MGFDAMKAWTQRTFEFNDHIQKRGSSWSGKFSFDSVEGLSIVHPHYEPPLTPPPSSSEGSTTTREKNRWSPDASLRSSPEPLEEQQTPASSQTDEPPSFNAARSRWRPTKSIHVLPESIENMPLPALTDSACDLTSPPLSPQNKQSLADKLYAASCAGDVEHMQLLLSIGAPIDLPSLVERLYDSFKPPKAGLLTALAGAAGSHQLEAVKFLLDHGAQLNPDVRLSSSSPLHQACRTGNIPIARFLLDAGADVDSLNCYRTTPLMYATKYASPELVTLILSREPDLHVPSFINTSAIHWAVWPGDAEIMDLLLRAGADTNHRMGDGSTPLHCAAIADLPEVAECLLRHGADPRLRDNEGQTPAQIAESNGYALTAELLATAELEARNRA